MRHFTVFDKPDIYASHPANHGSWQWGDEFLVGFLTGRYGSKRSLHPVYPPYTKMQARSRDGGETWVVETPNVDFNAEIVTLEKKLYPDQEIYRFCGVYDTGGETCYLKGGFYSSCDRGIRWDGPFLVSGLDVEDDEEFTSRTCVLPECGLAFLTKREFGRFGTDWISVCTTVDEFRPVSTIKSDHGRRAMPAVATNGEEIFLACRDVPAIFGYISSDNGVSWHSIGEIARTGGNNGNPPAVIYADGELMLAYGNRQRRTIEIIKSRDFGRSWGDPLIVRSGYSGDIGYPRLFQGSKGVCCVYYWSQEEGGRATIEASFIQH